MAWTTPYTWSVGELVTPAKLNEQLRDNLVALKDPETDLVNVNEGADYTTSSTTFVDVDAAGDPDMALSIDCNGGDIMVGFVATVTHSSATGRIYFDITVDGNRQGGDDGICMVQSADAGDRTLVSFVYLITGLSVSTFDIRLQWKTSASSATMYAGAGTSNYDVHPQLWAREVS